MRFFFIVIIYIVSPSLFIVISCAQNSRKLDGVFIKKGESIFFDSNAEKISYEFDKNCRLISIRDRESNNIYKIIGGHKIEKILHLNRNGSIQIAVYNRQCGRRIITIRSPNNFFTIQKYSNIENVKFFKPINDPVNSWKETEYYAVDIQKKDTTRYFIISYNDLNFKVLTDLKSFEITQELCDSTLLVLAKSKSKPKFESLEKEAFVPNFEGFNENVYYNNTAVQIQRSKNENVFGSYYCFFTRHQKFEVAHQIIVLDNTNPHLLFAELRRENKEIIDKEIRTINETGLARKILKSGVFNLKNNQLKVLPQFSDMLKKFKD